MQAKTILAQKKVYALLGASDKPEKYSYELFKVMQKAGELGLKSIHDVCPSVLCWQRGTWANSVY